MSISTAFCTYSKYWEVMRAIGELSERYGLPVANVFHAGDGNLHPLILYRAGDPGVEQRVVEMGQGQKVSRMLAWRFTGE